MIGDEVEVEVTLDEGATLRALQIELVSHSKSDEIGEVDEDASQKETEFSGTVEMMSLDSWTVSRRTVAIISQTEIQGNIQIGDSVQVSAYLNEDGKLIALKIKAMNEDNTEGGDRIKIEFVGTVEEVSEDSWVISGRMVILSPETEIDPGIALGDFVKVEALQDDGSLLANEINLMNDK